MSEICKGVSFSLFVSLFPSVVIVCFLWHSWISPFRFYTVWKSLRIAALVFPVSIVVIFTFVRNVSFVGMCCLRAVSVSLLVSVSQCICAVVFFWSDLVCLCFCIRSMGLLLVFNFLSLQPSVYRLVPRRSLPNSETQFRESSSHSVSRLPRWVVFIS